MKQTVQWQIITNKKWRRIEQIRIYREELPKDFLLESIWNENIIVSASVQCSIGLFNSFGNVFIAVLFSILLRIWIFLIF